jgi:1-acyl-sn-glycerol-3-phosphate acyltransferase
LALSQDRGFFLFCKKIASFGFLVFVKLLMRFYCPLKVNGLSNLPSGQPVIVCSNHCSHLDTAILMQGCGKRFKHIAMLAAKDYFFKGKNKRSLSCYLMNLIALDRSATVSSTRETLSECKRFLNDNNGMLIIYPEGTRSVTGEMGSFQKGAAYIALKLGVPILPAYIQGSFETFPKGVSLVRPGKCEVTFGAVITLNEINALQAKSATEKAELLTELMYSKVKSLGAQVEK